MPLWGAGGQGRGGAGESVVTDHAPPPGNPVPDQTLSAGPGVQTKAGGLQRSLPEQPAGRAVGVAATGLGPGLARSGLESPGPHCIFLCSAQSVTTTLSPFHPPRLIFIFPLSFSWLVWVYTYLIPLMSSQCLFRRDIWSVCHG